MLQFQLGKYFWVKIFYVSFYISLEDFNMNVHFFSQRITAPQYNYPAQSQPDYRVGNVNKYSNIAPLKSDTVSFGNAKFIVRPRIRRQSELKVATFQDILLEQQILQNPTLMHMGNAYYAALKAAAAVKSEAISICENVEHLVKTPDSILSKILRSGSFNVPDTIRATAFCDNPYNLDNMLLMLEEMKKSGYSISRVPAKVSDLMKKGYMPYDEERMIMQYLANPKDKVVAKEVREFFVNSGYDIKKVRVLLNDFKALGREPNKEEFLEAISKIDKLVPDIDIRLDSKRLTPEQIMKLPEELRYCVGRPQDSGYEDIQIRFIQSDAKKGNKLSKIPHELIILFGKNYYDAKTRESTFVYSNLRKFKELSVRNYLHNPEYDKYTELYRTMKEAIERLFINTVSKKEFSNAKCTDVLKSDARDSISFSKEATDDFDRYFRILISEIERPYVAAKKDLSRSEKIELNKALAQDRAILTEMRENLRETIDLYNNGKAYELTEPKPEPAKAPKKSKKSKNHDSDT